MKNLWIGSVAAILIAGTSSAFAQQPPASGTPDQALALQLDLTEQMLRNANKEFAAERAQTLILRNEDAQKDAQIKDLTEKLAAAAPKESMKAPAPLTEIPHPPGAVLPPHLPSAPGARPHAIENPPAAPPPMPPVPQGTPPVPPPSPHPPLPPPK